MGIAGWAEGDVRIHLHVPTNAMCKYAKSFVTQSTQACNGPVSARNLVKWPYICEVSFTLDHIHIITVRMIPHSYIRKSSLTTFNAL